LNIFKPIGYSLFIGPIGQKTLGKNPSATFVYQPFPSLRSAKPWGKEHQLFFSLRAQKPW